MPVAPATTDNVTSARGARLARRLFSNYVFQTMNWGVRLVEQLVLIPLYIYAWGPIFYKDWIVLYALVAFLGWCTLGTDEYFGNLFLRDVSVGDFAALKRRMRTGLFCALCVTGLIFALLYGALFVGNLRRLLGLSVMDEGTALFCLIAMTLPMSVWYCAAVLRGSYRAYGDFSRGECIFAIYNVTQIASVALALALQAPPKIVALFYMALPILYAIGLTIDIRRRYPEVTLGLAVPSRAEWRHIVPQSLYYFTSPLSIALNQNGVLLMFGFLGIGALETVKFNVLRIFTGLTRQIGAQSFSVGSGIEMARQHAQGDHEGCRRLYADTGRIVSCLGAILAGVSIPLSGPFVTLWTRGTVEADMPLILCFLVGILLSGPGRASLMLLRYTNNANAVALLEQPLRLRRIGARRAVGAHLRRLRRGARLRHHRDGGDRPLSADPRQPPLRLWRGAASRDELSRGRSGVRAELRRRQRALRRRGRGSPALALRLLVWAAIVLPLGLLLILSREQLRRLAAPLGRRLRPS